MSSSSNGAAGRPLNPLSRLLVKLLDGRLSVDEAAELREALREPRAREAYVEYMAVHTLLEWRFATSGHAGLESGAFPAANGDAGADDDALLDGRSGAAARAITTDAEDSLHGQEALHGFRITPSSEPDEPEPLAAPPTYPRPEPLRPSWWSRYWLPMTLSAAAAALLLGLLLTVVVLLAERAAPRPVARRTPVPPAPPVAVVTVTSVAGAQWDDPSLLAAPGTGLVAGTRLSLSQGLVELTFASGARVIMEAPASFVIDSSAEVSLDAGRLAARAAPGFTVRTPDAVLVDLGTEFGVSVDPAALATGAVGGTGATQVQVFAGEVRATPNIPLPADAPGPATAPTAAVLKAGDVGRINGHAVDVVPNAASPQAFVRRLSSPATVLDLVDLICGGEGTTKRRNVAIDENSGTTGKLEPVDSKFGDGKYHRVPDLRVVDGCFIPDGRNGPTTIDSSGRTFPFPPGENKTFNHIWAGDQVPWPKSFAQPMMHKLGEVDYSQEGHALLFLHASKGITIDLEAIRRLHPGKTPKKFRAAFGNTVNQAILGAEPAGKSQLFVLVDGVERGGPRPVRALEAPIQLDVDLGPNDRFFTLAVTDGEDSPSFDWTIFGDPRFELGTP